MSDRFFNSLVRDLSEHEHVESILLAGSRVTDIPDKESDYDIYVYVKKELPISFREIVLNKNFSYFELNNTIWETEDQGILKESGTYVDIVYRDMNWLESHLTELLGKNISSTGYSTCFWSNLLYSDILYDPDKKATHLKEKYTIPFSNELVKSILKRNYGVLRTIIPSYINQIDKAIKRNDIISVQHRITAFFESYFDIIFAINKMSHPGEKKILNILKHKAKFLPQKMEFEIVNLLKNQFNSNYDVLSALNSICDNLDALLKELNLLSI